MLSGSSVSAQQHGIKLDDFSAVTVEPGAQINGFYNGIKMRDNSYVDMAGFIVAGRHGIVVGDDSVVWFSGFMVSGQWGIVIGENSTVIIGRPDTPRVGEPLTDVDTVNLFIGTSSGYGGGDSGGPMSDAPTTPPPPSGFSLRALDRSTTNLFGEAMQTTSYALQVFAFDRLSLLEQPAAERKFSGALGLTDGGAVPATQAGGFWRAHHLSFSGHNSAIGQEDATRGSMAGFDVPVGQALMFGVASGIFQSDLGYGDTALDETAEDDLRTVQVAAYLGAGFGKTQLRATFGYSRSTADQTAGSLMHRMIAGLEEYRASYTTAHMSVSHTLFETAAGWSLTPRVMFDYQSLQQFAYATLAGRVSIKAAAASLDSARLRADVQLAKSFTMAGLSLQGHFAVGVVQEFGASSASGSLSAADSDLIGVAAFEGDWAGTRAAFGAGLSALFSNGLSLSLNYGGERDGRGNAYHRASAGMNMHF